MKRKTWREKLLNNKDLPRVEPINERMSKRWGAGTVALPSPIEVDALMKKVPKGKVTTVQYLRKAIAKKLGASIGCPLLTGIFVWIAAHAAKEEEEEGKKNITPFWRTLKSGGELNPKYPGGMEEQQKRLELEGHKVFMKGKKLFMVGYEKFLADIEEK